MRDAKQLAVQTDTPEAAAKAKHEKAQVVKGKVAKTKWSTLNANEKDDILCALAIQAGIIEEE